MRIVTTDDAKSDTCMTRVRPSTSEDGPTTSSARPRAKVVVDTDRADCAGVSAKARDSSGNNGWVV